MKLGKLCEIEIFKAGKRTASNGVSYDFPLSALKEVVDTYNPSYFRAPLIVSHDTGGHKDTDIASNELCYGVPEQLKLEGDRLSAVFSTISPQVVEWSRNKMLHSVSSSFYLPKSPNNPYPGKYSLRHIALLGKTPPAVKGLSPVELCEFNVYEKEEGVVEFMQFMYSSWEVAAKLFTSFREYLIDSESLEVADKVLPAELIEELKQCDIDYRKEISMLRSAIEQLEVNRVESVSPYYPGYNENMKHDLKGMMADAGLDIAAVAESTGISESDLTAFVGKKKKPSKGQYKLIYEALGMDYEDDGESKPPQMSEELRQREQALAAREAEFEERLVTTFVDNSIRGGKLKSGERDRTIRTLMAASNESVVEFEEGGEKRSLRQVLMDDIEARTPWNYNEEIVTPLASLPQTPNFCAPAGFSVDPEGDKVYKKVVAFCEVNNLDPNDYNDFNRALEAVTSRG